MAHSESEFKTEVTQLVEVAKLQGYVDCLADLGEYLAKKRKEAEDKLQKFKDHNFIQQLERRSMSTWSDEELARYSKLTGQSGEPFQIIKSPPFDKGVLGSQPGEEPF